MKKLFSVSKYSITLFVLLALVEAQQNKLHEIKRLNGTRRFLIHTGMLAERPEATWLFFNKEGKYEAGPDTPEQIVSLYEKQGGDSKKDGILIWCKLHSAPAIEKGKMMLTDHLQDRAKNTEYMKSLHEKVEALVEHCNKLGIPVWVNLQQHIKGDYKLLTQTIIKIEDRKSWTSSNGENIRGRVISFDPVGDTFHLIRSDGKRFKEVPLGRLISEDQEFIKKAFSRNPK